MAVYELDKNVPYGNLHRDSDLVATLTYPRVSVPVTFSGGEGTGSSGWVSQTSTNLARVLSNIKVRVSVSE